MTLRLLLALAMLQAATAFAQKDASPARVHVLVAAMGSRFHVVHEVQGTGSNLSPFRRETITVPDNLLNKLVLANLDKQVARKDPAGERVYLALAPPERGRRRGALTGEWLVEWIVEQLQKQPGRERWESVMVAIPGYRAAARERLPNRLNGMGIFAQPLCQSDPESCERSWTPPSGAEAVTPAGERIQANHFVAPYSLVEVLVLDPKTLQVVDRGESVEHQKLFDPKSGSLDIFANIDRGVIADRIVTLVERSVAAAVAETGKRGKVDVRERGEVKAPPR